jgi:DNA-directed RNA polymerase beta subunit
MQIDDDDDDLVAAPAGVRLRDPDDTDGVREDIESGVMKAMQNYVHGYEYGGTRLELSDMAYVDKPRYSLAEQREALLKDATLARRLRGTVTLVDTETNKPLEVRKNMTLARVPYLTQRGTMIHNGSEYAPVSQSRLLPGAYTRKRNNGELETHFNVRPGTGSAIRMSLDPTTGQYRMRVGTSNVHAYSVFKDLGVTDAEMERRWGPEILEANRAGYDSRAVDRVYMKAIPRWQRDASLPKADKARNVVEAFSRAQVAGAVLRENLPNLYSREKAASWRLRGRAMEKLGAAQIPGKSAPRAVIVKGNPYYIEGNPKADAFYDELARLVRANGYEPSFDAGEPDTLPDESASLWVGHSRGQDRLRFAPKGVKTLAVDQFEHRAKERRAENAKLMEAAGYKSWAEWPAETRPAPPDEHYQVTDDLRRALAELAVRQPSPDVDELPVRSPTLVEATQALLKKSAAAAAPVKLKPTTTAAPQAHHRYLADDDEHEAYESIGIDGLLAASEKLLAVNRGLERPDQRDTASNERVYTVDRLMAERVKLDHGKTLRTLMGRLSRRKNLSALGPAAFDAYTVDYLKGNPTASAIEEINPMNIMEQRRRITKMGPGGIGDPNAITIGMQSVDASQFGFVSPSEGPESEKAGIDVRLSYGARIGSDGRIYQLMRNTKTGKKQWVSPSDLKGKTVRLPD